MRNLFLVAAMLLGGCVVHAQDATVPPVAEHATLTLQGRGAQIYTCKAAASGPAQWTFVAPAARLFDANGVEVGTHGDGPVWHFQDGSSVYGKVIAKAPSSDTASIPWLLLKAVSSSGSGALTAVEFIRRSDTKGGNAPTSGCDKDHLGDLARIDYSATYTFYSSK